MSCNKLTDEQLLHLSKNLFDCAFGVNAQQVQSMVVELQEYRKAASQPVGWTDEQELRSVDKDGCGYLFKANPVSPNADQRRVILLYASAKNRSDL